GPRMEETTRAKLEWQNAEADRVRLQDLFKQGVIGKQEYDAAVTKAATAQEQYRELQRGNRKEDIDAAKATVDQAEGQLAYLQRQREETDVHSPVNGSVESIDLRPGDLVAANQPIAKILEPDQIWVRVYVPEPKLGLVHLQQSAKISVDTYPGKKFPGKVVEIRQQAEYTPRNVQTIDQRMDQVFGVKVQIEPSPELRAGMAANVTLDNSSSRR